MFYFFTGLHILLCVLMIFVILLQPGKDAGMGAALGGGAATSAFGGRGAATFLTKLTAFFAAAYFSTSLGLSFVGLRTSVADTLAAEAAAAPASAPVTGEAPSAGQGNPTDAPGKATPVEAAPSGADAVPAQKLPTNP